LESEPNTSIFEMKIYPTTLIYLQMKTQDFAPGLFLTPILLALLILTSGCGTASFVPSQSFEIYAIEHFIGPGSPLLEPLKEQEKDLLNLDKVRNRIDVKNCPCDGCPCPPCPPQISRCLTMRLIDYSRISDQYLKIVTPGGRDLLELRKSRRVKIGDQKLFYNQYKLDESYDGPATLIITNAGRTYKVDEVDYASGRIGVKN
jgi:hypothetical protein